MTHYFKELNVWKMGIPLPKRPEALRLSAARQAFGNGMTFSQFSSKGGEGAAASPPHSLPPPSSLQQSAHFERNPAKWGIAVRNPHQLATFSFRLPKQLYQVLKIDLPAFVPVAANPTGMNLKFYDNYFYDKSGVMRLAVNTVNCQLQTAYCRLPTADCLLQTSSSSTQFLSENKTLSR